MLPPWTENLWWIFDKEKRAHVNRIMQKHWKLEEQLDDELQKYNKQNAWVSYQSLSDNIEHGASLITFVPRYSRHTHTRLHRRQIASVFKSPKYFVVCFVARSYLIIDHWAYASFVESVELKWNGWANIHTHRIPKRRKFHIQNVFSKIHTLCTHCKDFERVRWRLRAGRPDSVHCPVQRTKTCVNRINYILIPTKYNLRRMR